jgi:hypothetical protein
MNQMTVSQIEQSILQLSVDEQLLIISHVAEKLRGRVEDDFEAQLIEMSNDINIQREIKEINDEFLHAELDGLEKY